MCPIALFLINLFSEFILNSVFKFDQKIDKEDFSSFYYIRICLLAICTARTVFWEENMDLKLLTLTLPFEETSSIKGLLLIRTILKFIPYYVRGLLATFKVLTLN